MNLQNLPWWGRLLLFVALAAAIIYVGYNVYPKFSDIKTDIASLQEELGALEAEIDKGRSALKRRAELEAQIQIKEAELALLRRILPTAEEAGDLVKWLNAQAAQVNLEFNNYSRGAVQDKEFYKEFSYGINVRGEYHDLGEFFERVSGHDRLVNVQGLNIGANQGGDRFTRSVNASFTAITFVYKEEGAQ